MLIPLSFLLIQCGRAPNAGTLAANAQASAGDSFDDRFPTPQFRDRFPSANESFVQRQAPDSSRKRAAQAEPAPYRVASLAPTVPYQRPAREDQTALIGLKSSAFPYLGNNPRTDEPFLDVSKGDRRGHPPDQELPWKLVAEAAYIGNRGTRLSANHQPLNNLDPKYYALGDLLNKRIDDPTVVAAGYQIPYSSFIADYGNGATLERDVRDRQLVPQQISDSGINAVLLAPQLAVDAADSSAGKFWQPGGLKRFVAESTDHLARLYGDPGAAKAFANMPVIIVGYSGGFLPAAWSLEVGGLGNRVRGVFLLDAVYGELDKFASWIENNRSGFFVSAYTRYTKRHDRELMQLLKEKDIAISEDMDGPLRSGSVVFVETPEGVTHRDYVTLAWTENPVKEVLVKMAATPALTRMAASTSSPSR